MLNTCFAPASLVCLYHFSARRSFAWATIAHLHQTAASSSSSSLRLFGNYLLSQTNAAIFLNLFAFFFFYTLHYNYLHESDCLFASSQSIRTDVLLLIAQFPPKSTPSPNATLPFPSDKIFSSDHGPFHPFLSPIPASPSFVTSISCVFPLTALPLPKREQPNKPFFLLHGSFFCIHPGPAFAGTASLYLYV